MLQHLDAARMLRCGPIFKRARYRLTSRKPLGRRPASRAGAGKRDKGDSQCRAALLDRVVS